MSGQIVSQNNDDGPCHRRIQHDTFSTSISFPYVVVAPSVVDKDHHTWRKVMGADTNPNAYQPLDPPNDPYPAFHWITEIGPYLVEAANSMIGFALGRL
ncbi:hypothetical protein I6J22_05535 [Corynebacterium kroppenstedtii]|nr:hypothetical protein [Corynebacterium kroppenstedtii]QRP09735.1 hypothetical protein I6J22_05535 [Corynebacterium kroppenstedtii]